MGDWVLVTSPSAEVGAVERLRRWFKRASHAPMELEWLLGKSAFQKAGEGPGFVAYRKSADEK
jgi:hypothetical protein